MKRIKNRQLLLFLLLAVFMLLTLGCSSVDPADLSDLSDQGGMVAEDYEDHVSENHKDQESEENGQAEIGDTDGVKDSKLPANSKDEKKSTCTYSINCATIFDNLDKIDEAVLSLQPKDGWIFPPTKIEFEEGESVFDILLGLTRQEQIHMEFNSNPALNSKYVEGINNLYEFDVGELSGWTYKINGKGMGYGSSSSYPKDGDVIEWVYTCDQGRDVGYEP